MLFMDASTCIMLPGKHIQCYRVCMYIYTRLLSFSCAQEYQKSLTELEGQLDDLEGLGQLLASECVSADREGMKVGTCVRTFLRT